MLLLFSQEDGPNHCSCANGSLQGEDDWREKNPLSDAEINGENDRIKLEKRTVKKEQID